MLNCKLNSGTLLCGKERIHISFSPKGGGLLRLSRAFSATLTERFGMGTVRVGAEGRWEVGTDPAFASSVI
jgi:hypothetical protein